MASLRRKIIASDWSSGDDNSRKVVRKCPENFRKVPVETNAGSKEKVDEKSSNSQEQSDQDSSDNCGCSTITFKEFRRFQRNLKLPVPTVTTLTMSSIYSQQREETFKNWLAMKDQEKKRRQEQFSFLQQLRSVDQQRVFKIKKEKYDRWWLLKKIEEENRKRDREKQQEAHQMMLERREKRNQQSEINYQLWLKQKEQMFTEKRVQEHTTHLKCGADNQEHDQRRRWNRNSISKRPTRTLRASKSSTSAKSVCLPNSGITKIQTSVNL